MSQPRFRPKADATPFLLDLNGVEGPLSWPEIFGNDYPVELEIGSGKGLFLQNAATLRPEHHFVGVEISRKYAVKAAERAAKYALENVKVWPGDARIFVDRFVPDASLAAVHVYFPDPWWKARHKKRRVFSESLVLGVERILVPGGGLHVATDVEEYFGVIRELVANHPRFRPLPTPELNEPQSEFDYLTNFERKYRIEGRPIYRAEYEFIG